MEESRKAGGGTFYDMVYDAERPELFFKATPFRTVGPNATIRIRRDATWNVPEPELALVISPDMRLVGYTVGNDVSSRDIEGENPLYLPQAKVYVGSCALGPVITLAESVADPKSLQIALTIQRGGHVAFSGQTSIAQMKRTFDDLITYLGRDNAFPHGVILLTGTGVVPPDDFTLEEGDAVEISISEIGTLRNVVERGV
jgi:2-dehydro-3-deoxy-D-arabinonate dehydratase